MLTALPPTDAANWKDIGADIDPSVIEKEIAKKAEGYIETTTETVAVGTNRPLVEDEIVKIKSSDGTTEYAGVVDDTGVATIDVNGVTVTVSNDVLGGLSIDNAGGADIDSTSVDIETETIHKIDSRLLPKSGSVDTQDYLQEALTVKEAQGKYPVGAIIPKDTPLAEIVKNMLTKTNNPTLTNPSATLTGSGNKLLETGATQNVTLTVNYDRGKITPAYGTSGYRAGEAFAYSINGGSEQADATFNETVTETNNQFTGTVKYAAGEQPLNDEGGNYQEPLAAGSITTSAVKYEFVSPIYSNASNIETISKEALVSKSAKQKVFVFPASTVEHPEVFDIDASWNVTDVEVKSELSGNFETCAAEFAITDVVHPNAAGTDVAYKRYTDSRGYASDTRTIRVSWS